MIIIISNSNWTKWSTIQGVIARVISKLDEHKAWGRFEIMSTITPWIGRHEVQVLINHIHNKFWNEKCLWEAKTSVALFINVENCAEHCHQSHQSTHNWHVNHESPITKSSIQTSVIGHPHDHALIMWQTGAQRTNHDQEFCYRYDYSNNNF